MKAAPKAKPRAKAKPIAKPRARAKAKPRAVEPVTFRMSRLPSAANSQRVSLSSLKPQASSLKSSAGGIAFGGLGWLLAGAGLLYVMTRKTPEAKALPLPTIPPDVKPPAPAPPASPRPPAADPNASDQEKLAIEYRRAKASEIPRDVLVRAPGFLQFGMGTVHFFTAQDGREFAAALEEHFHSAESGLKPVGKHKGVSMFIKRSA